MLDFLHHGQRPAEKPSVPRASGPVLRFQPPVHLNQKVNDGHVANRGAHYDNERKAGVETGVDLIRMSVRAHVQEAPRPGAILHVLPEPHERARAEEHARQVDERDREVAAARACDVSVVKVGEPQREEALQRHGAQDRERGQAQQRHTEPEVRAQDAMVTQGDQRGVLGVRGEHNGADGDRAQQVRGDERRDEDTEQRRRLRPPPRLQQREGDKVSRHAEGEHDARRGGQSRLHGERLVTVG